MRTRGPFIQFVADARPPKNAAAARVEELYNGFSVGTDAEGNEGYNAAQKAEEQLKLDFLSSFQNPQKNSANQTAWDEEEAQLISDSLKYGGDRALDAAAIYWGETHLNSPVLSPQELLAQAKTMQIADQPGEREFADRVAPRSRRAHAVEVDISEGRRGRIVVATQTINGKR
jgi:hypothetical protein